MENEVKILIGGEKLIDISTNNLNKENLIIDNFGFNYDNLEIEWDFDKQSIVSIKCFSTVDIFESDYEMIDYSKLKKIAKEYYSVKEDDFGFKGFAITFNKDSLYIILQDIKNIDSYYSKGNIDYFYSNNYLTHIKINNLKLEDYNYLKQVEEKSNEIKYRHDIINSGRKMR